MSSNPTPAASDGPRTAEDVLRAQLAQTGTTPERFRDDMARVVGAHWAEMPPGALFDALARAGRVPSPPHLPAPLRILTPRQARAVHDAVRAAARRRGVRGEAADEISCDALAAAGIFLPPPGPAPDTCGARYLPHDAEEFGPELLGQWQQCTDEPGHPGHEHAAGDTEWDDGDPGAVPARPQTEA
ncbi:hypothetical protein [Streptomyces sp. NPDC018045]|uniref:hypothetical protein n=1 Tax=Streptomyces sp. NPDC018045 TaxID=3365037 RepID=UPI0037B09C65